MVPVEMPRYTSFNRKAGCRYLSAALGENLPQDELIAAAKVWNDRLDAWKAERPRHAAGRDAIKIRHCRMALERLPEARSRPPDLGSRTSGSWRKDFIGADQYKIEVGMVGNEGFVGTSMLNGVGHSLTKTIVQIPGSLGGSTRTISFRCCVRFLNWRIRADASTKLLSSRWLTRFHRMRVAISSSGSPAGC